jgi:hypothetical protein
LKRASAPIDFMAVLFLPLIVELADMEIQRIGESDTRDIHVRRAGAVVVGISSVSVRGRMLFRVADILVHRGSAGPSAQMRS